MRIVRALGRFLLYSLVLLWAPAWLAAWWLWPPAPRSGWQIPTSERCLGFLSDSRHVVTEEVTGEGKERTATGTVHIRDIKTGAAGASYTSPKEAYGRLDGDLLIESTRQKPNHPPGGATDLSEIRVRDTWTGDVIFEDRHILSGNWAVCREHAIMAYARHIESPGAPEIVWRDTRKGGVVRTFPGLSGPLIFAHGGKRFLAVRWQPESKLHQTLLLIDVPDGQTRHSMRVDLRPMWGFNAQLSGNGRDVLVQGQLLDMRSGRTLLDCSGMMHLPSSDGRHIIGSNVDLEPALTWRSVASGQEEIRRVFGARSRGDSRGWMGRFDERDFQWVHTGITCQPEWPLNHRLAWLAKWLPEQPRRTYFIVAEQNTGQIIVQGIGHQPRFVSPDGRLLVMKNVDSGRELLWNIPFDAGLSWPVAAGAGLALPGLVLWRRRQAPRGRAVETL